LGEHSALLSGINRELRKVTWPTRKEATNLTIVVVIVTFSMSIILGFLDLVFSRLFALIWVEMGFLLDSSDGLAVI